MASVRPPGMPKTVSMPACSRTRTIASGTPTSSVSRRSVVIFTRHRMRCANVCASPPNLRLYPCHVTVRPLPADESSRLYELDRTHWLHPQGDLGAPAGTIPQLILASGSGAVLTDVDGRDYIDGMASLWN